MGSTTGSLLDVSAVQSQPWTPSPENLKGALQRMVSMHLVLRDVQTQTHDMLGQTRAQCLAGYAIAC